MPWYPIYFALHGAAQAQGRFERKLAFRPASLNSRFHKRLARAVDRSHIKSSRVRKVPPSPSLIRRLNRGALAQQREGP